jgi:two-component system sensor histidine kinase EvgS
MVRYFVFVLLFLVLGIGRASAIRPAGLFSAGEIAWMSAHPVVRIAAADSWKPIEYVEGGTLKGLSAAYLDVIARTSGLTFELVGAADSSRLFLDGKADLLPAVMQSSADESLRERMTLSTPYVVGTTLVITRESERIIFDVRHLTGKRVALLAAGPYETLFRTRYPAVQLLPVPSMEAALEAVATGQAFAVVGMDLTTLPVIRRKYYGRLHTSGALGEIPAALSFGIRSDLPELASIIEKSLGRLTAKQTDLMNEQWLASADYGSPSWTAILRYHTGEIALLCLALALLLLFVRQARSNRRHAVESERAKSRFLAVMSHEIRTPMNAVHSSIELLLRSAMTPHQRTLVKMACNASEDLLSVLDDVLDLSKLEASELQLEQIPTDVAALVEGAVEVARIRAYEKNLEIGATLDIPQDLRLVLDPTRVKQVLNNALSNAVKFTEQGSVSVHLSLESVKEPLGTLLMVIEDTGIGISDEQQRRLFRAFSQADTATTRRFGGSGLGLTICRELLALMHGTIELRSAPGLGTTVTCRIPVTIASRLAHEAPAMAMHVRPHARAEPRQTILIVEDNAVNRFMLEHQLRELGFSTITVADGQAALDITASRRFALVLLDCDLPDMDGFAVARTIRAREAAARQYQPIIAISAAGGEAHEAACLSSGMDGTLRKPLRIDSLQRLVEAWCVTTTQAASPIPVPHADLMGLFQRNAKTDLAALLAALEERRFSDAIHFAHRIDGAARYAHAHAIANTAMALTALLRAGHTGEELQRRTAELSQMIAAIDLAG